MSPARTNLQGVGRWSTCSLPNRLPLEADVCLAYATGQALGHYPTVALEVTA